MPRLIALTPKATSIVETKMGGDPKVRILDRKGKKVLFSSSNGKHCGWVDLANDPDWSLVLSP